jgi:YidC/Oxa1 family membrane protein insertase
MKVLRPEINELGRNSKKDPMKQQETMKLYNKAGVNQWPVASFITNARLLCFVSVFPSAIGLRQEGFFGLNDLSSYDSIYELPFHIPFYGNHISCFDFGIDCNSFMKMTTGDQQMAQHSKKECQIWQK